MSELGYYSLIGMFNIHWPWCVQKNHRIIFRSLLDIRVNVLLDISKNVQWPRFWTTLSCTLRLCRGTTRWWRLAEWRCRRSFTYKATNYILIYRPSILVAFHWHRYRRHRMGWIAILGKVCLWIGMLWVCEFWLSDKTVWKFAEPYAYTVSGRNVAKGLYTFWRQI